MRNKLKDLLYSHFDKQMNRIIECEEKECEKTNHKDCRICYEEKIIKEIKGE